MNKFIFKLLAVMICYQVEDKLALQREA